MAVRKPGKPFIPMKGEIAQIKREVRDLNARQDKLEADYQHTNRRLTEHDTTGWHVKLPHS